MTTIPTKPGTIPAVEITGMRHIPQGDNALPGFLQVSFTARITGDIAATHHVVEGRIRTGFDPAATLQQLETAATGDIARVLRAIADQIDSPA